MIERCQWPGEDPLMRRYHDEEWGVPVHDDRKHFEFIVLDGMQAGLSWQTILRKRESFRRALDSFDPVRVAGYGPEKIAALMADAGIVRNRQKIEATIGNARALLEVQASEGSFDAYIWRFVDGRPIQNRWRSLAELPAQSPEAERMSKALKARGFRFVGPTICYAYMQAAGLVNDHVVSCFRHAEVAARA